MRATELKKYKTMLIEARIQLTQNLNSMANEALKPQEGGSDSENSADFGSDQFEQEFTLGLMENKQTVVKEIDAALDRIEDSTFGVCEGSGDKIPKARLDAIPWARYTVDYQERVENGLIPEDF
ncbi:MAG: TraR/DksA C4-type zinc finger protein [Planctomycetota bacterium]